MWIFNFDAYQKLYEIYQKLVAAEQFIRLTFRSFSVMDLCSKMRSCAACVIITRPFMLGWKQRQTGDGPG